MENVKLFLNELEELYKKYGFSIGHEDSQGGFIIEDFDESNVEWIKDASVEVSEKSQEQSSKMKRISKDQYYVDIALAVSKRSTCLKRHYGCVIVKDDIIIATGYNGSPRGEENCCDRGTCKRADAERYTGYENCDSVHAEQNALIATSRERLIGSTVYLACESYGLNREKSAMWEEDIYEFVEDKNPVPCGICARMLKNAGIVRVVNRRGDVCL